MDERVTESNGLELCYQTVGEGEPMLLIMGLGAQLIHWPAEFVDALAARGFRVVRYDNRDAGRSSRVDAPPPSIEELFGGSATAPYLLADMADDAAGLLDALGIERAHVVGASMGGMVAQQLAIDHPERVRSLCSLFSTTGDRVNGLPHPEINEVLTGARPTDREGSAEHHIRTYAAIGSPAYPPDPEYLRERGRLCWDRGISSEGYLRQLAAIMTSPDRTTALGALEIPTLVIHGNEDPLIDVSGGTATAAAIPGAELLLLDGMGHDLPNALHDQIIDAITANAERAA